METTVSKDGTRIAFERTGDGPPLVLVVGAFNLRSTGTPLAESLASRLTVFTYDRRGRGDSGDTAPYSVEREVEDLAAVIGEAGGSAAVFGYSSGAVLALDAAARGLPITRLALYDTPCTVADGEPRHHVDHAAHLAALIAAGRRGDAVEYFQSQVVGIPDEVVAQLRHAPFRPGLEAMAHTLVYDATIVDDGQLPTELVGRITTATLALAGGTSDFMRMTAQALADAIPSCQARVLDGQTHDINPSVLGPVLQTFCLT
jgi:pimeloyl-ACP methyl ester carboxylesterase